MKRLEKGREKGGELRDRQVFLGAKPENGEVGVEGARGLLISSEFSEKRGGAIAGVWKRK
jgi:hypothetical protein